MHDAGPDDTVQGASESAQCAPHHRNAKTESRTSPHVWSAVPCISDICFSIPARRASASCCRVSRTRPTPATIGALDVAADVRSKLPYCSMLSLIYCHREDALVDVVGVMLPGSPLPRSPSAKCFPQLSRYRSVYRSCELVKSECFTFLVVFVTVPGPKYY